MKERLKSWANYLRGNPVLVMDGVKIALAALVVFGLPIPPGIDVLVAGGIIVLLSMVTRQAVTPNAKVEAAIEAAVKKSLGVEDADPSATSVIKLP